MNFSIHNVGLSHFISGKLLIFACSHNVFKFFFFSSNFVKFDYFTMLNKTVISKFSTFSCLRKEVPNNLKGKSSVSQEWLRRQLSDPYVKLAKYHNFRCRSAYKLLQIDDKYKIFHPGQVIIDCGAAPGSWCQVAATRSNSNQKDRTSPVGKVIGIDIIQCRPVDGVTFLAPYDLNQVETHNKILEILNGEKADVVLSDMAPNASGLKELDHDKLVDLLLVFLRFSVMNTKIDGTCLLKLLDGKRTSEIESNLRKFYQLVKLVKPDASRQNSSEIYFLARNFKGVKTIKPDVS